MPGNPGIPSLPESTLRSHIAQNLNLIGPDLELIKEEYHLPNPDGAHGSIDILARNTLGQLVVIELKRADQTARQALHELEKYVALLASSRGIRVDQLRCVLISTTWHELRVPFSRFVSHVDYLAEGILLHLGNDGLPSASEPVALPQLSVGLEMCPLHTVFCFGTKSSRDSSIEIVQRVLSEHSVADYVLALKEFTGASESVMYPFMLYLALAEFSPELCDYLREQADSLDLHVESFSLDDEDEDQTQRWEIEEGVSAAVARRVGSLCDEVDQGAPERFRQLQDWPETEWRGFGRFSDRYIWNDGALQSAVAGVTDGFASTFGTRVSVAHPAAWSRARQSLDQTLERASGWQPTIRALLDEIAQHQNAELGIGVYAPGDLLGSLNRLGRGDGSGQLPHLMMDLQAGETVLGYGGMLLWDGVTIVSSADEVLGRVFNGDFFSYLTCATMGGLWELDEELCEIHGLTYEVLEFSGEHIARLRVSEDGILSRIPLHSLDDLPTPDAYRAAHEQYLDELAELFHTYTITL